MSQDSESQDDDSLYTHDDRIKELMELLTHQSLALNGPHRSFWSRSEIEPERAQSRLVPSQPWLEPSSTGLGFHMHTHIRNAHLPMNLAYDLPERNTYQIQNIRDQPPAIPQNDVPRKSQPHKTKQDYRNQKNIPSNGKNRGCKK